MIENNETSTILHGLSILSVVGSIVGFLPAIAGGLGCVWYVLQIYDWVRKYRAENQERPDPGSGRE
jgi:hypothetical protein